MEFNLILPYENEIDSSDKTEIDRYIESTIELHKNNANKLTELTLEAASCLAAGEARAKQLSSQGFFKNLWGAITGKNRKIRGEIDYNFAVAQKASQRMIQVLAEQNKLTFEAVIAVNNKLNTMSVDINNQINEIYSVMKQMFQGLLGQIVQNSLKIEKLEQNVKLLNWNATIEYLTYDNRTYSSLDTFEKIICLSNDFYRMAGENRTTQDMLLLKTTMANCGIDINSKIKAIDFYRLLSSREDLIKRLFEDTKIENLEKALSYTIPISSGFRKLNLLSGEENYIVKSITSLSEASEEDIKVTLTKEYVKQHSDFDIEKEINIYEFAVMLVDDLGVIDSFVDESQIIEAEETVPLLAESNTIETLFEEGKYYKVIEECNKIIEFNENNEEANKEDLINAYKYRAKCYLKLNFNTLKDIEKIQELNKNDIESYEIKAKIYLLNDDTDKALLSINNGLEINDQYFSLYQLKYNILCMINKEQEALNDVNNKLKEYGDIFELLKSKILIIDYFFSKKELDLPFISSKSSGICDALLNGNRYLYESIEEFIHDKYLPIINKAISLCNNDYELHYLYSKYSYKSLFSSDKSLAYKDNKLFNITEFINNYLNIVSHYPYSGLFSEPVNLKSIDRKSYINIINNLNISLNINPKYENAFILKGLIFKISGETNELLKLRDEYVKQGFDPDKIFNKLFNG
ncbi:tetratricopeptide repeat protein [Brachyspira hampsonii]|uniref:tetratricopeptide repeat protein n=1 Tax=Brachyspira hampsonii TaxID=1287055 RepID=UPI000D373604|nr:hypothetical protein [Brachyspira hampsonii]PTY39512.1 hypothetical protein DQ06_02475 [Brachyspira hampsonii bv. II]